MSKLRTLEEEIADNFRELPHPIRIVSPECRGSEPLEINSAFREIHWKELSPGFLLEHPAALPFFTPEAFRFFLPGFLMLALREHEQLDFVLPSLVSALTGPGDLEERLSPLTQPQLSTVISVLETIAPDEDDPTYWELDSAKNSVLEFLTRP